MFWAVFASAGQQLPPLLFYPSFPFNPQLLLSAPSAFFSQFSSSEILSPEELNKDPTLKKNKAAKLKLLRERKEARKRKAHIMIRNISRLAPLSEEPINEEDSNNCSTKAQTWKKWLRTHFSLQLFTKKSDLRILLSVLGCPLFPLYAHPKNPITEVSLFFSSFFSLPFPSLSFALWTTDYTTSFASFYDIIRIILISEY